MDVHVPAKTMWYCFDLSNDVNFDKVLDRDGGVILECLKGDQYVLDQTRNKGHTAQVGYLMTIQKIFDLLQFKKYLMAIKKYL